MVIHGDCLTVMAAMEPESVDAIVTDPPYGLEFMGKEWDKFGVTQMTKVTSAVPRSPDNPWEKEATSYGYGKRPEAFQAFSQQWAEAAYRVAKPSAYLLAFGGTRTVHRMTVALEDAGWIIRDMLVWGYASGFPKSKASLKPAWEPIVMARKPGPLRMLAIDECRIGYVSEDERAEVNARTGPNSRQRPQVGGGVTGSMTKLGERHVEDVTHPAGRWPANIVLTDPIFDGGWEGVVGGGEVRAGVAVRAKGGAGAVHGIYGAGMGAYPEGSPDVTYGDSGTYSRFFIIPKADRADREPVLGGLPRALRTETVDGAPKTAWRCGCSRIYAGGLDKCPRCGETRREPYVVGASERQNVHPTVKPTDLASPCPPRHPHRRDGPRPLPRLRYDRAGRRDGGLRLDRHRARGRVRRHRRGAAERDATWPWIGGVLMVIRIARPGEPTRFVDMGPAHGRVFGGNYGGSIVIGGAPAPNPAPTPPSQIARAARNKLRRKAQAMGLCGRSMKTGGICARALGHGSSCRDRAWMDRRAIAQRTTMR